MNDEMMTEQAPHDPIPLVVEGAWNLRDLGGIVGAGGRRVRPGRMIRSGELVGISDDGARRLAALGLARIVDFRS